MLTAKQIGGLLLAAGILAAWPSLALGPPPSGGPPGQGGGGGGGGEPLSGTVYFMVADGGWWLHTMQPDGSAKAALPLPANAVGDPSRHVHGGHRWHFDVRDIPGEFYPYDPLPDNGIPELAPRREIFAVRDDGNDSVTVQLTDQPDLELLSSARWGIDDLEISWIARRWHLGTATVLEGGIYVSDIDFDGAGNVLGLTAQPAAALVGEALIVDEDGILRPDIRSHDWAPDAAQIVYDTESSSDMVIADLIGGTSTVIVTSNPVKFPVWSPDGSQIAFQKAVFRGSVVTIKPDGSDEKVIVKSRNGNYVSILIPQWSPTGSHLLYQHTGDVGSNDRSDVFRATSGGGGKTNLTSDLDTRWFIGTPAKPVAWRGD